MGLALQLDHIFGSKWMLNKLHLLGTWSLIQRNKITNTASSLTGMELASLIDDEVEVDVQFSYLSVVAKSVKVKYV